jgi:hypothetical protein
MSAINRHDLECRDFEGAAIEEITAALAGRVVAALGVEFAPLLSTPVALATEVMVTTYLADHLCAHHGWSVGAAATYLWQDADKLSARLRIFHQPPPSWRDRLANSALERSLLALVPARAFPRLKRVQALNASLDRILGTQSMAYQLFAGSSAHDEFIKELRRSCATYGSTGRAVTELEVRGALYLRLGRPPELALSADEVTTSAHRQHIRDGMVSALDTIFVGVRDVAKPVPVMSISVGWPAMIINYLPSTELGETAAWLTRSVALELAAAPIILAHDHAKANHSLTFGLVAMGLGTHLYPTYFIVDSPIEQAFGRWRLGLPHEDVITLKELPGVLDKLCDQDRAQLGLGPRRLARRYFDAA